jgi:hypothetical protein
MVAIFADSNRARIRVIKEANNGWGLIPSSGATRELRYTSSSVTPHKNTVISDEIRADRMVADHIEVGANSTGDVGFEFSAGSHDFLLESFMYGTWTRPMTFDSVKGNRCLLGRDQQNLHQRQGLFELLHRGSSCAHQRLCNACQQRLLGRSVRSPGTLVPTAPRSP